MRGPEAALRLLGLAARAGAALGGTERVREGVRGGRVRFAVIAADASENARDKLVPLLEARAVPFAVAADRESLGDSVGRGPLSAVGVTDEGLAGRVRELLQGCVADEGSTERGRRWPAADGFHSRGVARRYARL